MTDQRELDRLLGAYFVEGTNELADRVIDAALDQIDHTDQRRPLELPRRFPIMNMPIRIAAAAIIGVLAVGGAYYLSRPDQPAVGGPSPEPTASYIAGVPISPSPGPSLGVVQRRAPSWIATGNLIEARIGQTATLLTDGKVLVAGGGGIVPIGILPLASAELYDPGTGSWTATGPMATSRDGLTATLLRDGKVLVTGGEDRYDERLSSAELYDPGSGSWTATGNMATSRRYHTATLLPDGKVLVAGGEDRNDRQSETSSAELYDPSNGSWTTTGTMIGTRAGHTATLLRDGKVLVAGGYRLGDSLVSAEVYDPGSGSWTATGNMVGDQAAQSAATQTATLLPDGTVLVAGSTRSLDSQPAFAAELYDPRSGAWSFTGPMDGVRFLHTSTLLPDGTVLVAGGGTNRSGRADLPASAELYDPSTGSWTAARSMITPHVGHTATLLLDGRVLVMGGTGTSALPASASTELYDPGVGN